jgi:hypothetical protein
MRADENRAFSRNWSTEAVTHALQRVVSGTTTRLIINIPPRNLKSICASVAMPAFLLGHNPTRKLAAKFSNDCRAVMRTDWYQQTFPRIDKAKDTESEVRTTERGYRLATSVGGTLTGRGGDIIITRRLRAMGIRDKDLGRLAVAERLCGTTDRHNPAGVCRPPDRARRGPPASGPHQIRYLSSWSTGSASTIPVPRSR